MAITITPGYDFTVNEVPTKQTIKLLLDNIEFADIPPANLDAGLLGINYGNLSGNTMTTMIGEGNLMYDIHGHVFVLPATGAVCILHNSYGGYETIRFRQGDPLDTGINNPVSVDNFYGHCQSLVVTNESLGEVFYQAATTQSDKAFHIMQDTGLSGFHQRVLLCGSRRGTTLVSAGLWNRVSLNMDYVLKKTTININEWKPDEFPAINSDAPGLANKIGLAGPEEPNEIRAPCWLFGMELQSI